MLAENGSLIDIHQVLIVQIIEIESAIKGGIIASGLNLRDEVFGYGGMISGLRSSSSDNLVRIYLITVEKVRWSTGLPPVVVPLSKLVLSKFLSS